MAKGKFSEAQRKVCWERSGGYCEVCGCTLRPVGWNLHHRQALGMGGTSARIITCADGLVICGMGNTSGCHRLMDEEREWAQARGFVVPRNGRRSPVEVPVLIRGEWLWLTHDGRLDPVDLTVEQIADLTGAAA